MCRNGWHEIVLGHEHMPANVYDYEKRCSILKQQWSYIVLFYEHSASTEAVFA